MLRPTDALATDLTPRADVRGVRASARKRALARARRGTAFLFAQLLFIAAGVFLGNQADSYKERRDQRALLRSTLQNFRADVTSNRQALARVIPYHAALHHAVTARDSGLLVHPARTWDDFFRRLRFQGMRPVGYSDAAWDLALATRALPLLDPPLRFELAELYRSQRIATEVQSQFMASAFSPQTFALRSPQPLTIAMESYLENVVLIEPALLRHYETLLPRLDALIARLPK